MAEGPGGPEYIPTPEERRQNRERARGASPQSGASGAKNWWGRRSTAAKILIIIAAIIVIGGIAGAIADGNNSGGNGGSGNSAQPIEDSSQSSNNGPLVSGTWNPECNQFSAGDQDACAAIEVTGVSCQWQDNHVHMGLVLTNTFGAHVTVHMNPIYKLQNAGIHGNGLTSVEDVGLDPGEVRNYETDLSPKGVSGQPAITLCRPGVDTLLGVELG